MHKMNFSNYYYFIVFKLFKTRQFCIYRPFLIFYFRRMKETSILWVKRRKTSRCVQRTRISQWLQPEIRRAILVAWVVLLLLFGECNGFDAQYDFYSQSSGTTTISSSINTASYPTFNMPGKSGFEDAVGVGKLTFLNYIFDGCIIWSIHSWQMYIADSANHPTLTKYGYRITHGK